MSTQSPEIQALMARAMTGMLLNASRARGPLSETGFSFWRGYLKALRDLSSSTATSVAMRDAMRSGYEPPGYLKAAFTALPVDVESLTLAQVQQHLTAYGVEITADAITHGQLDAVQQLEDSKSVVIHLDDEHAAAVVDGDDGSLHGDSSLRITVAQQGGAA